MADKILKIEKPSGSLEISRDGRPFVIKVWARGLRVPRYFSINHHEAHSIARQLTTFFNWTRTANREQLERLMKLMAEGEPDAIFARKIAHEIINCCDELEGKI